MMIVARPSGAADSLMATPTLPLGGLVGDNLVLHNGGSADILLTSEETLPGSKLSMRSQQTTLAPKENITFGWDGEKWVETARSAGGGSSDSGALDSADYGVSVDNDGVTNAEKMLLAIAAAQAANKDLLIPSGRTEINGHGLSTVGDRKSPFNRLTQSVTIRGRGREASTLVIDGWVEPTYSDPNTIVAQNDNGTAFFQSFGLDVLVKLKDLTLEGPPEADLVYGFTTLEAFYMAGGGSVRLENVRTKNWNTTFKLSPNYPSGYPGTGTAFSADENCLFEFRGAGVLTEGIGRRLNYDAQSSNFTVGSIVTGGTSGARAAIAGMTDAGATGVLMLKHVVGTFVDNETITDAVTGSATVNGAMYGGGESVNLRGTKLRYQSELDNLITQLPTISNARHGLYISNGTSLRTIGCEFLATGGSAGESGCAWRHYSVGDYDVPEYSESNGDYFHQECAAAIIPNPNFLSTIIAATVHTSDRAGNTAIQLPGPALFDGLHLVGYSATSFGISDGAFTAGRAIIMNSVIEGDWVYALSRTNAGADRWQVGPNVEFRCTSSGGGGAIRSLAGGMDLDGVLLNVPVGGGSVFLSGGDVRMGRTRFAAGCKALVITAFVGDLAVEFLPGNKWDDATEPIIVPTANDLVLTGQGRNFALSAAPAGTISGSLQCARGVGTYAYAANRLSLVWEGDTFLIDEGGGPTVNNINMTGSLGGGGAVANDLNAPCQATVKLYVAQAFTLGNSGNIVAAAGARSVGAIVTLQYLPSISKWVEVSA